MLMVELGRKLECHNCGTRFYDLGKAGVTCPKCGESDFRAVPRRRKKRGPSKAAAKAKTRQPRVFVCYAKEDVDTVRVFRESLEAAGIDVWFDETHLLPGQDWQAEIKNAISGSDAVIVCLSKHSVSKRGFVQTEIKTAIKEADRMPEGTIYLIPVLLEECEVPTRFASVQWAENSPKGVELIVAALEASRT